MSGRPNWFIGWPFSAAVDLPEAPPKVRRFAPTDLHVTAAFLGRVEEPESRAAWSVLETVDWAPFDASLGPVRMLGGREPTAVAALIDAGADRFRALTVNVRTALVGEGLLRPDARSILPHITVARIQRSATPEQRRDAIAWAEHLRLSARARIDRLALYTWSEDRTKTLFTISLERFAPSVTTASHGPEAGPAKPPARRL